MSAFELIDDEGSVHGLDARVDAGRVSLAPDAVEEALGWALKSEGLCRGDVCVPVRDRDALLPGGRIDLAAFAAALGRPLALDAEAGAAALGTASAERAARMATLEAPDFALPDLEGRAHRLSDHRGRKVLLVAYASW